ncbi:spindle assembly abnormal protein 6 homolog [Montipora foliosa]|uniref:spindle assembly abnormal protein 6 homolog n=1 Tax=Montipora foliosa TaxID=591990 RepID=UPI0035F1311D
MKKTILCQQERTIQENREALLLLEKNKVDIMNEVARANHEIDELKTKLAKKNSLLKNSQDFQDTLLLQAEKLRFEKEQLNQRCENVINEMKDRLRVKDSAIGQVREEIDKYMKLQKEVKQRNEVLKRRLEKREKIVTGLKTKLTLLTTWSVRSGSVSQIVQ